MSQISKCFGYVHFQEKKSAKLALKALKKTPHFTWQVTHFMPDRKNKVQMQTETPKKSQTSKDKIAETSFPANFERNLNLNSDFSKVESETISSNNSQKMSSNNSKKFKKIQKCQQIT